MIFLPLLTLSQEVIINPLNETVLLDKDKAINVAKIIENEKRLRQYVADLEKYIIDLNDTINKHVNNYNSSVKNILDLTSQIEAKEADINNLTEKQLDLEKKRNKGRLYGTSMLGFAHGQLITIDVGINYSRPKVSYLFSVDPYVYEKIVYKLGVGIRIF